MVARSKKHSKTGTEGKTAERARYVELARQGLSNGEICRMLGIFRRTGTKWRYGYTRRETKTGRVYLPTDCRLQATCRSFHPLFV